MLIIGRIDQCVKTAIQFPEVRETSRPGSHWLVNNAAVWYDNTSCLELRSMEQVWNVLANPGQKGAM